MLFVAGPIHRHKPIMLDMALETRHHRSLLTLLIPLLSASFIFTCSYGYILGLHPLGTVPFLSRTPNGFLFIYFLSTGFSGKFILEKYPYAQLSCSSTISFKFLKIWSCSLLPCRWEVLWFRGDQVQGWLQILHQRPCQWQFLWLCWRDWWAR